MSKIVNPFFSLFFNAFYHHDILVEAISSVPMYVEQHSSILKNHNHMQSKSDSHEQKKSLPGLSNVTTR